MIKPGSNPMRTAIALIVIGCLWMGTAALAAGGFPPDKTPAGNLIVKGRFGVEFTAAADLTGVVKGFSISHVGIPSVDKIFDDYRVSNVRALAPRDIGKSTPMSRIYIVEVPDDVDDASFKSAMRANPYVVEIQNDILCPVYGTPDDPGFSSQWHHYQAQDYDIDTPEAWDIETGSDTAVIAMIDVGVLYRHPDLANNIWINPAEDIDGDGIVFDSTDFNGHDEDSNGYIDDVIGYDFFTGGSYPPWPGEDASGTDNDPSDFNGHGTHTSGIAAAVTNNAIYGAGIAGGWGPLRGDGGARIMCLRVGYSANVGGEEAGYFIMSAVVEAINYAADNGADIISYSAGSSNFSGMAAALSKAMDSGIVFCNAAGNDNDDIPDYFGTYPGIITVAATNNGDRKWTWNATSGSDYGSWVEVSAPGQNIYSTVSNHYVPGYAIFTGTSMAAPMVAGLAALIKSHHPDWDKEIIDTVILNNADNIDALNPSYVGLLGSGRINAYNCLQNSALANFSGSPRIGTAPVMVDFTDLSPSASSWSWSFGDGDGSSDQNPQHIYSDPGLYNVSLEVTDPNGTNTKTRKYYVLATADTLTGDSTVKIPSGGTDSAAVTIYLKNTIPIDTFTLVFVYTAQEGSAELIYRGVSFEGPRGQDFDTTILRALAPTTHKVALEFIPYRTTASNQLMPGEGAIAKIWFSATGSGTIAFDTITLVGYSYNFKNHYAGDYMPDFRPFTVIVGSRGDANNDGTINVADAVFLINYIFKGGPAPDSEYLGDANGDGTINVGDAVYLIQYIFGSGPPPPP
jgi:subtilisin family serine protease